MPMMPSDNPVGSIPNPYGRKQNAPRGAGASKTLQSDPLVGVPSVPMAPSKNMYSDAPNKSAPASSAPSAATGRGTSGRGPNATMPRMSQPTGGRSMASAPKTPQFQGGPQPNRTISSARGGKPSAKASFGKASIQ